MNTELELVAGLLPDPSHKSLNRPKRDINTFKLQRFTAVDLHFFTFGSVLSVLQKQSTHTELTLLVPLSRSHMLNLTIHHFCLIYARRRRAVSEITPFLL